MADEGYTYSYINVCKFNVISTLIIIYQITLEKINVNIFMGCLITLK